MKPNNTHDKEQLTTLLMYGIEDVVERNSFTPAVDLSLDDDVEDIKATLINAAINPPADVKMKHPFHIGGVGIRLPEGELCSTEIYDIEIIVTRSSPRQQEWFRDAVSANKK